MARAGRTTHKHVADGLLDTDAAEGRGAPHPGEHAAPRHKAARRRQLARVAGPTVFALSLAGTLGAWQLSDDPADPVDATARTPAAVAPVDFSLRTADVSRSISRAVNRAAVRPVATAKQVVLQPTAVDHEFVTAAVNVRTGPSAEALRVRTLPRGARVGVTGQAADGWAEVLVEREAPAEGGKRGEKARTATVARWVNADFLAERKPAPPEPEPEETPTEETSTESSASTATSGVSTGPCPDGSTIESGLTSTAVGLYRAVCAAFPALTTYGGYDPHGEHIDGRAIDFMITDSSLGQAVANYIHANAAALGVRDIIWAQQIWIPERASEGWRYMEDRGSPTANHYDHVHAAVY